MALFDGILFYFAFGGVRVEERGLLGQQIREAGGEILDSPDGATYVLADYDVPDRTVHVPLRGEPGPPPIPATGGRMRLSKLVSFYGKYQAPSGETSAGSKVIVRRQWADECLRVGELVPTDQYELIGVCKTPMIKLPSSTSSLSPVPSMGESSSCCPESTSTSAPGGGIKRESTSSTPGPSNKRPRRPTSTSQPPQELVLGPYPLRNEFELPFMVHWLGSVRRSTGKRMPPEAIISCEKVVRVLVPQGGGELVRLSRATYVVVPLEPGERGRCDDRDSKGELKDRPGGRLFVSWKWVLASCTEWKKKDPRDYRVEIIV